MRVVRITYTTVQYLVLVPIKDLQISDHSKEVSSNVE